MAAKATLAVFAVSVFLAAGRLAAAQSVTARVGGSGTVAAADSGDLPSQWAHQMRIEFCGYSGTTALSNFPALVVLREGWTGFHYDQCASPAGGDLRFMNAARSQWLSYEIENWTAGSNSLVWVRVPELAGTNTTIWALWGNPDAATPPAYTTNGATWVSVCDGVWHLGTPNDSSGRSNHATAVGSPHPAPGAVGSGMEFAGNNWLKASGAPFEYAGPTAVELWFRDDGTQGYEYHGPIGIRDGSPVRWSLFVDYRDGNGWIACWNGNLSLRLGYPGGFARGRWHHLTVVDSGANQLGTTQCYVNGERVPGVIGSSFAKTTGLPLYIGHAGGMGEPGWIGGLDEVRIHSGALSADWIRANYLVQASNAAFLAASPMVSNAGAVNVTPGSADLTGRLHWTNAAPTCVWVCWGTRDGGTVFTNWEHTAAIGPQSVGSLAAGVGSLSEATYYYRFRASNVVEEGWSEPAATFVSGAVNIRASQPSAAEAGPTTGEFTVTRPPSCAAAELAVNYVLGGTAGNGVDYRELPGTVVIPAGATSAAITVTPIPDSLLREGMETVQASLAGGPYVVGSSNVAVVTIADRAEQLPSRWPYAMRITFPGYTRATVLTNFPALVIFSEQARSGFRYSQMASPAGGDLRFMDATMSSWLNFEVEQWAPGSNTYVWVQIPRLPSEGATIHALWGNPESADPPPCTTNGTTWAAAYDGVWHLTQTGAQDSSGHANHFTAYDGPVSAAGPVNRAVFFSGANRLQALGGDYEYAGQTSVEFWMRSDSASNNRQMIGIRGASTRWSLHQVAGLTGLGLWNNNNWVTLAYPGGLAAGRWYHVVCVDSGADQSGTADIYVNGTRAGAFTRSFAKTAGQPLVVGTAGTGYGNESWVGGVDEVRIAPRGFSADWIWATWRNQASNETFVASQPMLANLGATNVTAGSADLAGYLYWTSAAPTAVWAFWGGNDGGTVKTNWDHAVALGPRGVGPLGVTVSIAPDTLYAYRFYASNAVNEGWADPAAGFAAAPVTLTTTSGGDFVVHRPAAITGGDLVVRYAIGGTARSGVDYQPLSGSVLIPAGSASAVIDVVPLESFSVGRTLELTLAPGGYLVGAPDRGVITLGGHPRHWPYSMAITFSGYTGAETLTNFPALVVFDEALQPGFRYDTFASPTGGDLRFTDAAATRWLAYEIDEWHPGGRSLAWVQVPALAGTNVTVRACWGNRDATAPPAYSTNGAAWSAGYAAVYHFAAGGGGTAADSMGRRFDGTLQGGPTWAGGALGWGLSFDGVDDYVDTAAKASTLGLGGSAAKTGEAWVYVRSPSTHGGVFTMGDANTSGGHWGLRTLPPASGADVWQYECRWGDLWGPVPGTFGVWVHAAVTFAPTTSERNLFLNGTVKFTNRSHTLNTLDNLPFRVGRWTDQTRNHYVNAVVDEVRLSTVTRSADWLRASWSSQRDPFAFAEYQKVSGPQAGALLIVN